MPNEETVKTGGRSQYAKGVVWLDKVLYAVESNVALVCFVSMMVVILYGIVMRFVLRAPNPYGEEFSRYMMIYFIYLGVSLNVRFRGHLAVEMIVDAMPDAPRKFFKVLSDLITIAAYVILTILATQFFLNQKAIGQSSSAMRLPMYIVYLSMAVGFAFASLRSALLFWNDYFAKEKVLSFVKSNVIMEE